MASDRLIETAVASRAVAPRTVRLSPVTYQRVTLFGLVALAVIVVSGAAVRLTGSGLGCPQWPNCDAGHLTPHGQTGYHAAIEFVNRTFTGLVSLAVILPRRGPFPLAPPPRARECRCFGPPGRGRPRDVPAA